MCLNGFLGLSSVCIIWDFLGHCESVSEPRGGNPRRWGQQKRGSCAHTHAPKETGSAQHSPSPGAQECSALPPTSPAFLMFIQSAPLRMNLSCSSALLSQFPPHRLCTYIYCFYTHHVCIWEQEHTHHFLCSGRSTPCRTCCCNRYGESERDTGQLPRGGFGYNPLSSRVRQT